MPTLKKEVIQIDGMTCASCELRIENILKKVEGVKEVSAKFSEGKVYVHYNENMLDLGAIEELIVKAGYTVKHKNDLEESIKLGNNKQKKNSELTINQLLGIGIILFSLYVVVKNTIGFNFIPEINQSMSYGLLFVVGLLTSLHCIAMCGGINMSQCISQQSNGRNTKTSSVLPSFQYNLGRVISYTIIGGIVGALGSVVSFSGTAKGIVAISAGIFMMIMGINMLNIFPWLRKFNPRMPKIFGNKVYNNSGKNGPFYVGLLNGLMPCGPLQAMQLYALGTGSFLIGATSMLVFSLGTVPLMFGFGAITTILGNKFTKNMLKVSAVLVMILGVLMISRGLSLSGLSVAFADSSPEKIAKAGGAVATLQGGIQTVKIDLKSNEYAPIVVQKDVPVRFIINAEKANINGCNGTIIIPKYNIQKALKPGENVIEFTPTEEGKIAYSCWMGMIRSNILVVPKLENVSENDLKEVNEGVSGGGNLPSCCQ